MPTMPMAPLVSIALPVRNAEPWLGECMDSVLAQTEPGFELLAVDDGSTDRSRAMLEQYGRQDRRVRVLETSGHARGISAALNVALAEAQAPCLLRMDADDRMHPERVARQLAALEADASLFGVASRAAAFSADEIQGGMRAYLDWQNGLLTPEELARDRFIESPVLHPSVALRTQMVREHLGGWREAGDGRDGAGARQPWPEDWDFFLRAFEAGLRIARLPEVLVEWRLHPRQATRLHACYSEEALLALRSTFLARHLQRVRRQDRSLWVLGAGPVGKKLIKALARSGVVADGLADVDPRKIGGVVRGAGHRWRVVAWRELEGMTPRPFAVSAVSGADARVCVRSAIGEWGWQEGADFVVAA